MLVEASPSEVELRVDQEGRKDDQRMTASVIVIDLSSTRTRKVLGW
jgi:hypothetical protein